MTQLLEQSMRDICAAHDLINFSITIHVGEFSHLDVSVQWNGIHGQRGCTFGSGETIDECVANALHKRNEARSVATIADVAIEQVMAA